MNNKEKIKREALFLFAEKGFDKTSVREIAKKVGIRESAIYNHYKSKNEIFSELLSEAKSKLHSVNYFNDELFELLPVPEKFFLQLTKIILENWSKSENKAYTKLIIQARFNSSIDFDFRLEEFFLSLRKVLEIVFTQLKNYEYVKNYPVDFLIDQYLSPLIVIKFKFLINDFFDKEQVFTYATQQIKNYCSLILK